MTPDQRTGHVLLAALALIGRGAPIPGGRCYVSKEPSPPPSLPPMPPLRECLQIVEQKGAELRHSHTGEVRTVRVWANGEVDFRIGNRTVRRSARRALDWLRNAEAAGGAS